MIIEDEYLRAKHRGIGVIGPLSLVQRAGRVVKRAFRRTAGSSGGGEAERGYGIRALNFIIVVNMLAGGREAIGEICLGSEPAASLRDEICGGSMGCKEVAVTAVYRVKYLVCY